MCVQCEHPCLANTRGSDRMNLVLLCWQDTTLNLKTKTTKIRKSLFPTTFLKNMQVYP